MSGKEKPESLEDSDLAQAEGAGENLYISSTDTKSWNTAANAPKSTLAAREKPSRSE
ncbi:MAG: hypothetical protein AAGF44_08445 [Pseudomonadota bacterium]